LIATLSFRVELANKSSGYRCTGNLEKVMLEKMLPRLSY
jgi:hypothetical protein